MGILCIKIVIESVLSAVKPLPVTYYGSCNLATASQNTDEFLNANQTTALILE